MITGGAGGIAACTARLFSKHGAKVIIAVIRDHLGKSVCNNLGPDTTSFVHCYVSSESNIVDAIDTTADKHGKLDIMVNNAATGDPVKASTLDNDKADFEVVGVNLTAVFFMDQACSSSYDLVTKRKHHQCQKRLLERGWGGNPCIHQLQEHRQGAHKDRGCGARALWNSRPLSNFISFYHQREWGF